MTVRKLLVRHRDGRAAEVMMYLAEDGARQLGLEVEPFEDIDQAEVSAETAVAGYIGDVRRALQRLDKPEPIAVDYPEELETYLCRDVTLTTPAKARQLEVPRFVKPARKHKLFTGFVHRGDAESRLKLVKFASRDYDDAEVWSSELIDFKAEFRAFVLRGKVIDVRRYRGDFYAPAPAVVESMARRYKSAPAAYCLDVGLCSDSVYRLVEVNDALSFGGYGLSGENYVRMLAARWEELVR